MFLAVWMLYVADRLLDTRALIASLTFPETIAAATRADLEARHYFHHRHRRPLLILLGLAAVLLAVLLPRLDPAVIRLDLLLGSLLFAYFILIHATGSAHRLPKELSVGMFFSAAVATPTFALVPSATLRLLPMTVFFAILCCLNCLFIYQWEHRSPLASARSSSPEPHPLTRAALRSLTPVTATVAGLCLLLSFALRQPAMLAVACSAALLLLLDATRAAFSRVTLRAAADFLLLTPLPLLWLHRAA